MRVLVTGASGLVGGRLVPPLVEDGHDIPDGVDVAAGDLLDSGSFEAALDDINVASYLVHPIRAGKDFDSRGRRAARKFTSAASDRCVGRVVHLGGLEAERNDLPTRLRSSHAAERIFPDIDYALTMHRAATVVGAGSASFEMMRHINETPFDGVVRRGLARGRDV